MDTLQYIKQRIKNTDCDEELYEIDWEKSHKWHPIKTLRWAALSSSYDKPEKYQFFKDSFSKNQKSFHAVLKQDDKMRYVNIIYKKSINPSYYKYSHSRHDGTLLFVFMMIEDLFIELINGVSYSKNNVPDNYLEDDFWDEYDVNYYVSDILYDSVYVNHVSEAENKMFPGEENNMIMAVEIEYIKHE
jgi:hypothetical protein